MYQEPTSKPDESILEQLFTSTPAHSVKWTLTVEQYSQRIDDDKWIRNWKVMTYIGNDAVLRDHFSYSTREKALARAKDLMDNFLFLTWRTV